MLTGHWKRRSWARAEPGTGREESGEEGIKTGTVYGRYIKRALDFILSLLALVVLSPLLLGLAILVRIKLGSPVVFRQPRPGKNEKIFFLYKFRSMTNEEGPDGRLLPDAQRLTKFGRVLRATSLDELPELVNIIKGDMSIVGPRPLSIYYLSHYPAELRKRHSVRPGLTGLAQVNGRNNLPWDERFALDVRYVENISFALDARIVLDTARKVLRRADVSVRGTNKVKDYGPYQILQEEGESVRNEETSYSEIGSYFWLDGSEAKAPGGALSWLPAAEDSAFTFSGRNAIDLAARDALRHRRITRFLAPSYSCVSMLQAFIDRGMKIEFYPVSFENGRFTYEIPPADGHTLVLIMSYFGLNADAAHSAIERLHAQGAVVIEDVTHSLLRRDAASAQSDYLVASLRKWFAVPAGGWVGKRGGALAEKPDLDSNHAVEEKIAGMREKYEYLAGRIDSKENFLLTQAKFDNDLIHVDRMLKIDDTSLGILAGTDESAVIEQRRRNAETLLEGLRPLNGEILTIPEVDLTADTLLFLPVFLETGRRDALRAYLIGKGIYCPIHWPEGMGAESGLRENELSLICDQRYTVGDMTAIVHAILDWVETTVNKKEDKLLYQ